MKLSEKPKKKKHVLCIVNETHKQNLKYLKINPVLKLVQNFENDYDRQAHIHQIRRMFALIFPIVDKIY